MQFILICLAIGFISVNGNRIAGGETTTIDKYPFASSLLYSGGTDYYAHACGGTILTTSAILSAASCFYTGSSAHSTTWWRARVGTSSSVTGGIIYLISRITPHPSFSTTTLDNDIAVLTTTWTMQYTANVQPASLVGGAYTMNSREEVWAIGWGATSSSTAQSSNELRAVQFWVVDQQTCTNRYQELNYAVTSNMVCGGWLDVGVRGQCQGDAGSPLLQNGNVVGVFSWAEGCANGWYPNLNTRVSPYGWWILSVV